MSLSVVGATTFFGVDLSGTWRAAPADEELRRQFHLDDFDDEAWEPIGVPGHWQDTPAFADNDDAMLFRHSFVLDADRPNSTKSWLEFDGLFYQGDVYLDGEYLGDTEGYFVEHAFDITHLLAARSEHTLAVELNCHPAGTNKRRSLLGVFEGANDVVHSGNPGGIWAPVRTRQTGPIRIDSLRAICSEASAERAKVKLRATMISGSARTARIATTVAGVDHEFEHVLAEGPNEVSWDLEVPDPELWWPRALGGQPLHDLRVTVDSRAGEQSDERSVRIGFRSISNRRWNLLVNGERIFVKGVNLAPTTARLAHSSPEVIADQLDQVTAAGFDMVRPYAHVAAPSLYAQADERGLLVWQDMPLLGQASNSLRSQAVEQATAMVNQLGHHPSIAFWNAHVSPAPEWMQAEAPSARRRAERFAAHQLPTWTKSVLDRSIKRAFDTNDGSRPSAGFTGVLPHLPRLDSSASHLWFGWRRGSERDLGPFAARLPSQVQFVAEFGSQSIPDSEDVRAEIDESWPLIDTEGLQERLGYEAASFDRYVPPTGHLSSDSWIDATQQYQAGLLRRQIETLRRLKYRPTGGFSVHFLADCEPRVSAALIDHSGVAKPAYQAVTDALAPVIVVADRLPATIDPGTPIAIDLHVVSDLRSVLTGAVIDAEITWPGGSYLWRFGGDVAADDATRIGTLSWMVPDAPGLATLTLHLSGAAEVSNRYVTTIARSR